MTFPRMAIMMSVIWLATGCQGLPSKRSPIHLNPNMDSTERYNPQAESGFFVDARTMRPPVEGTVAQGELNADDSYYRGLTVGGEPIPKIPVPLTAEMLDRGEERFDIFCAPCHGRVGDGQGIITQYEYPIPPPSFHQETIRQMADGYLYQVITDGVRNMPSYKHQIPVQDRWAIVAYLRALQRSQYAREEDLPKTALSEVD